MRQLGTLPDIERARTLTDYLSGLAIDTRLEESAGNWVVWVCDEDRLGQARDEFQAFLQNPGADRYYQATKTAAKRRADEALETEMARRPLVARRPSGSRLRLTFLLIGLSLIITVMAKAPQQRTFVGKYLFITALTFRDGGVFRSLPPELSEVKHGEVWRLITPIFIHFGAWHLLFNMLWLFSLGGQLEKRYGPWRLALLVVVLAAASNLCQYLFSTVKLENWKLIVLESHPYFGGMSGVVFGLFGFVWMKTVYERGSGLSISPGNVVLMLVWLLLCMSGLIGPIANTAHLVGLALGMLLGYTSAWWNRFGLPEPEQPPDG